jgi:hypothetical protein
MRTARRFAKGDEVALVEHDHVSLGELRAHQLADVAVGGALAHGLGVGQHQHRVQTQALQQAQRARHRRGQRHAAGFDQDLVGPRLQRQHLLQRGHQVAAEAAAAT